MVLPCASDIEAEFDSCGCCFPEIFSSAPLSFPPAPFFPVAVDAVAAPAAAPPPGAPPARAEFRLAPEVP